MGLIIINPLILLYLYLLYLLYYLLYYLYALDLAFSFCIVYCIMVWCFVIHGFIHNESTCYSIWGLLFLFAFFCFVFFCKLKCFFILYKYFLITFFQHHLIFLFFYYPPPGIYGIQNWNISTSKDNTIQYI